MTIVWRRLPSPTILYNYKRATGKLIHEPKSFLQAQHCDFTNWMWWIGLRAAGENEKRTLHTEQINQKLVFIQCVGRRLLQNLQNILHAWKVLGTKEIEELLAKQDKIASVLI